MKTIMALSIALALGGCFTKTPQPMGENIWIAVACKQNGTC